MRRYLVLILLLFPACALPALVHGLYNVTVTAVVDGDTFKAQVHIFPALTLTTSVRVRGVDTPELKGKCADEKKLAMEAKTFTAGLLEKGGVMITNVEQDAYPGRIVADVLVRGESLADKLIIAGLGVPMSKKREKNWCAN